MPIDQFPQLTVFLEYLKFEKRYSRHTLIAYQNDLEQFFAFLLSQYEGPAIQEITPMQVRSWLAEMKEDALSSKSLNRKISSLKSFFKYQIRTGVLTKTPMTTIVSPRVNKRLPAYVEEVDISTLFDYVDFTDDWKGRTERLVLQLFYHTGMRLSELIGLKESQVDSGHSQVKVLGKGNKERLIPISRELLASLQKYMAEKPARLPGFTHVFTKENGSPLMPRSVYAFVNEKLAMVTTVKQKSPHILRHSFATHLMNKGADLNAVKELLGHSSLAATQIYTHNSIEKLKEVFQKAHPKA